MPTSYVENIPTIVKIIQSISPKRILDLGIGNGKYAFLAKEYLENVIIDGVEAWQPYIRETQKSIYNTIINKDISSIDFGVHADYDLYLMIDVIEHFDKEVGYKILRSVKKPFLISTPLEDYRAEYENPYENHKSHWVFSDFAEFNAVNYSNYLSTIALLNPPKSFFSTGSFSKESDMELRIVKLQTDLNEIHMSKLWKIRSLFRKLIPSRK